MEDLMVPAYLIEGKRDLLLGFVFYDLVYLALLYLGELEEADED